MKSSDDSARESSPRMSLPEFVKPLPKGLGSTTDTLGKLSIVLAILTGIAIFTTFSPKFFAVHDRLSKTVPTARCVVYDKPPRTGSTTIAATLKDCFTKKGYNVISGKGKHRSELVAHMVSSEADRMAMVRTHVSISEDDLTLLKEHCGELLYLTSAAPMKQRLYSALKYSLTSGHGNSTIDRDMVDFAESRTRKSSDRELMYEHYPHVRDDRSVMEVKERMVPDYVIRKEFLTEDMTAMMGALNCNITIRSANVHVASTEEKKALDAIEVQMGDAMYKWLLEVAEDNEQGLQKAREF